MIKTLITFRHVTFTILTLEFFVLFNKKHKFAKISLDLESSVTVMDSKQVANQLFCFSIFKK